MARKVIPGSGPDLLIAWRGDRPQAVAAEVLGVDPQTYNRWERRKRRPDGDRRVQLARDAGIPVEAWSVA